MQRNRQVQIGLLHVHKVELQASLDRRISTYKRRSTLHLSPMRKRLSISFKYKTCDISLDIIVDKYQS